MPDEKETRRDWDTVQENSTDKTERLRIPGGHLYRVISAAGISVVFVPGE